MPKVSDMRFKLAVRFNCTGPSPSGAILARPDEEVVLVEHNMLEATVGANKAATVF